MIDFTMIFFFAGIIFIAAIMFALMTFGKKGGKRLNIEKYRVKYLEIENQLEKDKSSTFYMTILNADKLVDKALKERGMRGETMGERMRNAGDIFRDKNGLWSAHKLRNKIAHESDAVVSYNDTRYALASFKKALKDLGAI